MQNKSQKLLCAAVCILYCSISVIAQQTRFHFSQPKMGSPFQIVFFHDDSIAAQNIASAGFHLVDSLSHILSDYDSSSEINHLRNRPAGQKVSPVLYDLLLKSKNAWFLSDKTFDITAGSITHLWREKRKEKKFPSAEEIKTARKKAGWQNIRLSEDSVFIFLQKNIQLDFGGIAKGYIAQKVADHLKGQNVYSFLIDAGGDMVLGDKPPASGGWRIAVNKPESEDISDSILLLQNCAVATSGSLYQFILHDGKKYSHIIDPRTGYGITALRNVTIIAEDGAQADWLATACSILPIEKAMKLVNKEKAKLLMGIKKDGETKYYYSYNSKRE